MSWISDVKQELNDLDTSRKNLRKFAFLIGSILLIIAVWIALRKLSYLIFFLGVVGMLLIAMGLLYPTLLKKNYIRWMWIAFAMGWLVSRILLAAIFYFIITPIGLTLRLFGKDLLGNKMKDMQNSYWAKREKNKEVNYEKMY
jgi:VIT1/CCC1 family predicted Fe2+/Mn2+ transporter